MPRVRRSESEKRAELHQRVLQWWLSAASVGRALAGLGNREPDRHTEDQPRKKRRVEDSGMPPLRKTDFKGMISEFRTVPTRLLHSSGFRGATCDILFLLTMVISLFLNSQNYVPRAWAHPESPLPSDALLCCLWFDNRKFRSTWPPPKSAPLVHNFKKHGFYHYSNEACVFRFLDCLRPHRTPPNLWLAHQFSQETTTALQSFINATQICEDLNLWKAGHMALLPRLSCHSLTSGSV